MPVSPLMFNQKEAAGSIGQRVEGCCRPITLRDIQGAVFIERYRGRASSAKTWILFFESGDIRAVPLSFEIP